MSKEKKGPPPEEKGETAPLWIISFADMISLLMAFFVMLLTMATARSGKLCNDGMGIFESSIGGFKRSITGFGVPELFGQGNEALDLDSHKAHYSLNSDESQPSQRTIDGREEKIRRIFTDLERRCRTYKSTLTGRSPQYIVAPITFKPKGFALDASAKNYLSQFAAALQQSPASDSMKIYIVGLANDSSAAKDTWTISTRRAQAVAKNLRSLLGPASKVKVFCWGAGSGGQWTTAEGPAPKQAHILLATLQSE